MSRRFLLPRLTRRRLLAAGAAAGLAPVLPVSARAPSLPFFVIGDWGRFGFDHQRDVAVAMAREAERLAPRFIVSAGDNFYDDGVFGLDDPHWRRSFEDIYRAPALGVPWYVTLGNHDYRGNVEAQLAYGKRDPRWMLPARYYARTVTLPDGTAADFFFLDTSPFIRHYYGSRTRVDGQNPAAQRAWLDEALGSSSAPWKIVIGHHPLYTAVAGHGHDQPDMIEAFEAVLQRHRVPLYINGHDHTMQWVVKDGITYLTSGAGSRTYDPPLPRRPGFASGSHGFLALALEPELLRFDFISETGQVAFSGTVRRPSAA
jgi:tartrate-resistant acid phosphatase type 5